MATTYIESDIDQFIRSQKAKLQQERNIIGGPQGKGGRGSGRKSWDKPQDNKYANQNDNRPESPEQQGLPLTNDKANQRRAELNKERQKEYNEILQNKQQKRVNKRLVTPDTGLPLGKYEQKRKQYDAERQQDLRNFMDQRLGGQVTRRPPPSRDRRRAPGEAARQSDVKVNVQRDDGRPRLRQKEVTPPYDGMKFGDFEEYRKRIEDQRKQEYKHDLEKQVEEKKRKEAEQKHKENVELASRHPYVPIDNELRRMQREEQRRKVYDRRLAEQNRKRDGDAHDLSPRSRSLSPVDPQYESYVEERLRREAEIRRQEEEALREAEARRAYEEQLTERELQRQQELLQRQRLESLEDEVKDNYKTPRGDPYRPPGLMPEERSKEYQRLTEQNPPKTSKQDSGNDEGGGFLKLGGYENKRKQLEEERHQDYLRFQQAQQNKKRDKRNSRSPVAPKQKPPSADSNNNVSDYVLKKVYETEMRHINEEKRELDEYLEHKRKVHQASDRKHPDDLSPRGGKQTPDMISKLGGYQKERAKLDEERKKDYNRLLAETTAPPRAAARTEKEEEQFGASLPGLQSHESAEVRKQKQRNEEYNEYLREKQGTQRRRDRSLEGETVTDKHAGRQHLTRPITEPVAASSKRGKEYATLPGLNYSESAEKRKVAERNREYNELLHEKQEQEELRKRKIELRNREYNEYKLQKEKDGLTRGNVDDRPGGPRRGWHTPPSYEEILDKKRREEAQYRRREDPDYYRPGRLRKSGSDGALNTLRDEEIRIRALDRELEGKKRNFKENRRQGVLEDDNWLALEKTRPKDSEYRHLYDPIEPTPRDFITAEPRQLPPPDQEMQSGYYATLPVGQIGGHDATESAKRRRKEKYRDDLQLQIRESEAAKLREKRERLGLVKEKNEGLKVNASGYLDPEKTSFRMKGLGDNQPTPRRAVRSPEVVPYHTKFVSPRRGEPSYDQEDYSGGGITGLLGGGGGGGITDVGLGGPPRERSRSRSRRRHDLADGGNILDKGFDGLIEPRRAIGSLQPPPGLQYQPSTYVTGSLGQIAGNTSIDDAYFKLGIENPLDPHGGGGGAVPPLQFGGDDYGGRRSPRPRVQFVDTPRKGRDRSRERISPYMFPSDDDNRSRSRQDSKDYQAELERQILENKEKKRREKEEKERYERKIEEEMKTYNPYGKGGGGAPIRDNSGAPIADLRQMHLENIDPNRSSRRSPPPVRYRESPRYQPPGSTRDDLIHTPPPQQNVLGEQTHARGGHGIFGQPMTDAEKYQADKYKEDLKNQIEEKRLQAQREREQQRIEEEKENRRIEEQRKRIEQEYEEEQRKKREKEEEARRKNDEMRRQAEERKKEAERKKRDEQDRRNIEKRDDVERERILSERQRPRDPIPGPSQQLSDRPNSSDVLKELAQMRKQLQSERRRVENALETQRNEPEVFDPRMVARPPPRDIDVFERAKQGTGSVPQRAQTSDHANPSNIHAFNELKYKDDTYSRRAFRSMFPEPPITNSALEYQQDALLRHQQEKLNEAKTGRGGVTGNPGNVTPKSLLQSQSAFIDVDGINNFPDDFDDMPKHNAHAPQNRNYGFSRADSTQPTNYMPMGSQTSLDVDKIQRKNEARLKRLQQMNTDDVSMADPDDILDNFMAKQRLNRPPSGQTLQDDSWLRPGSKPI